MRMLGSRIRLFAVMCVACAGIGCATTPSRTPSPVAPSESDVQLSLREATVNRGLGPFSKWYPSVVVSAFEDPALTESPFPLRRVRSHFDPATGMPRDAGALGLADDDRIVSAIVTKNLFAWMWLDVRSGSAEHDVLHVTLDRDASIPGHPRFRTVNITYDGDRFATPIRDGEQIELRFGRSGAFLGVRRLTPTGTPPVVLLHVQHGAVVDGTFHPPNANVILHANDLDGDGSVDTLSVIDAPLLEYGRYDLARIGATGALPEPTVISTTVVGPNSPSNAPFANQSSSTFRSWRLAIDDDARYPGLPEVRELQLDLDCPVTPIALHPGETVTLGFDVRGVLTTIGLPSAELRP